MFGYKILTMLIYILHIYILHTYIHRQTFFEQMFSHAWTSFGDIIWPAVEYLNPPLHLPNFFISNSLPTTNYLIGIPNCDDDILDYKDIGLLGIYTLITLLINKKIPCETER